VGRFSLLIFLEIVDETTNDGTGSSRLLIDIFEFVRQYRVFNQKTAVTDISPNNFKAEVKTESDNIRH